jgi:HSP20 family molecular chaperone IbpA
MNITRHNDPQVDLLSGEPAPSGQAQSAGHTRSAECTQRQPPLKPQTNLYSIEQGWLLVAALPEIDRSTVSLDLEGDVLKLFAKRLDQRIVSRAYSFPKTSWGELKAEWEGDLLKVTLLRALPTSRAIHIA